MLWIGAKRTAKHDWSEHGKAQALAGNLIDAIAACVESRPAKVAAQRQRCVSACVSG